MEIYLYKFYKIKDPNLIKIESKKDNIGLYKIFPTLTNFKSFNDIKKLY